MARSNVATRPLHKPVSPLRWSDIDPEVGGHIGALIFDELGLADRKTQDLIFFLQPREVVVLVITAPQRQVGPA